MPKDPITLGQLMQYLEKDDINIQVSYNEWNIYDTFWSASPYLKPYHYKKIDQIEIIDQCTIRLSFVSEVEMF